MCITLSPLLDTLYKMMAERRKISQTLALALHLRSTLLVLKNIIIHARVQNRHAMIFKFSQSRVYSSSGSSGAGGVGSTFTSSCSINTSDPSSAVGVHSDMTGAGNGGEYGVEVNGKPFPT